MKWSQSLKNNTSRFLQTAPFIFLGVVLGLVHIQWGFAAHRCIHDAAIHALPTPLHGFFKSHRDWIVGHALDADKRKHAIDGEAEKHYIDLDRYGWGPQSSPEFIPQFWNDAQLLYGDTIELHGIGPWATLKTYQNLTRAFFHQNETQILRTATDIAHYISDLNVPLHTSSNYNGAQTNQDGIHAFWETQLPEQFMSVYRLTPGSHPNMPRAKYLSNPAETIWKAAFDSHLAVDSVLRFETILRTSMGPENSFAYVQRGRTQQRLHSPEFAYRYHQMLDGQVERRMQQSIFLCASLWYSAWVDAGQPILAFTKPEQSATYLQRIWSWLSI